MNRSLAALTILAVSASALFARSPMPPKFIGFGGPGATTFKNLLTVIQPFDPADAIDTLTQVIVDEAKPGMADFPFIAKVRVTLAGKAHDYDLHRLPGEQLASAATFRLPRVLAVAPVMVKLEFLRGLGFMATPPDKFRVDPSLTRIVGLQEIKVLRSTSHADPELHIARALASSLRPASVVLEMGKTVTLNGVLGFHADASAPNIRVRGYPVLKDLFPRVVKPAPAADHAFIPVQHVALMGYVDVGALTNLLGGKTRVSVHGKFTRIYYVVNTGGPTEVLQVDSISVRGKKLPQDLPLTPGRLETLARQLVAEHLTSSPVFQVKSVTAQQGLLYTVVAVGQHGETRTYQVDLLDRSLREVQAL